MMFFINDHLFIFINYLFISVRSEYISVGWQTFIDFSGSGYEFSPKDMVALFLESISVNSTGLCAEKCHSMPLCRTFDFDPISCRCRIFQGDSDSTGSIISSFSSQSVVGSIAFNPAQFISYRQSCSFCQGSRYLQCINKTCQCQSNTYFDGSICRSQKLLGGTCINTTDCRIDRNYSCLPRQQCGRKYFILFTEGTFKMNDTYTVGCRKFLHQKRDVQLKLISIHI